MTDHRIIMNLRVRYCFLVELNPKKLEIIDVHVNLPYQKKYCRIASMMAVLFLKSAISYVLLNVQYIEQWKNII